MKIYDFLKLGAEIAYPVFVGIAATKGMESMSVPNTLAILGGALIAAEYGFLRSIAWADRENFWHLNDKQLSEEEYKQWLNDQVFSQEEFNATLEPKLAVKRPKI